MRKGWNWFPAMIFGRWVTWAQVAERLMAADCKSAAPWSYGGSNPPLCTTDVRGWIGRRFTARRCAARRAPGIRGRESGAGWDESGCGKSGPAFSDGPGTVCGFGFAGLVHDGRGQSFRSWKAGRVEVGSADCDWRIGIENVGSPPGGENSPPEWGWKRKFKFVSGADVAQLVEHSLGKGEVTSSILVISSRRSAVLRE